MGKPSRHFPRFVDKNTSIKLKYLVIIVVDPKPFLKVLENWSKKQRLQFDTTSRNNIRHIR